MQFEDFDMDEPFKCNCQLLQTVQNLVNKYRSVISGGGGGGGSSSNNNNINESSSLQFDLDHHTHHHAHHDEILSSRPSTVCGPVESSSSPLPLPPHPFRAVAASPEYVLSEASTRLSTHVVQNNFNRNVVDLPARGGGVPHDDYYYHQPHQHLRDSCSAAAPWLNVHAAEFMESSPPPPPPPVVRITRIPNRTCPVHSRIDQRFYAGTGTTGCGTAFQMTNNYETISMSNCWQGLKLLTSPSDSAAAAATATANSIGCSSTKLAEGGAGAGGGRGSSGIWLDGDDLRRSCRKFVESMGNLTAWGSIVAMLGSILFLFARGYE